MIELQSALMQARRNLSLAHEEKEGVMKRIETYHTLAMKCHAHHLCNLADHVLLSEGSSNKEVAEKAKKRFKDAIARHKTVWVNTQIELCWREIEDIEDRIEVHEYMIERYESVVLVTEEVLSPVKKVQDNAEQARQDSVVQAESL